MTHASIVAPAAALLVLGLAGPARADDHTLHLAVHGSIDSAKLGPAIARELGVEVAIVNDRGSPPGGSAAEGRRRLIDGTCALPCLDITIDGSNTAAIVFVPRSGALRQRTVKLGTNTTQWPLVVTLLAGNVVRDESRDVLEGLPPARLPGPPAPDAGPTDVPEPAADEPEAPPPVIVPPVVVIQPAPVVDQDPVREHRFLSLGLVPGLSTDLTRVGSVQHFVSVQALVGVAGGSSGVSLSGLVDVQRGLVSGIQIGGLVSTGWRVAGTQVAGIAAVAGELEGVQIAGTAAIAHRVDGLQAAGIASYSRSHADTQIAGVVAAADGSVGTQVAGVSTTALGDAGLQIAGVANVARGAAGVQVAGSVNVARRIHGLQLAPINVAGTVEGVQVGVINVGSADGFSFGLINIVPGGRYDVEAAIDTDRIGTVLFRHGGRRWHNVYGVGGQSVNETATASSKNDDIWMYGLGFGPTMSFGDTVVDLELIGWQVNHGARHESDVSVLGQLRLSVAHHWGPFAIVAGGMLNTYVTNDAQSPLAVARRSSGDAPMDAGVTVTTWPSAFVGVRL
jgi:hypothetical protein